VKGACGLDGDKGEKVSGCPRGAAGAWVCPGGCGPLDPLHWPWGAGRQLRPELSPTAGVRGPLLCPCSGVSVEGRRTDHPASVLPAVGRAGDPGALRAAGEERRAGKHRADTEVGQERTAGG